VSTPTWVLDTGAILAYAHGVEAVGRVIADAADTGTTVAVPVTCLIEAYSLLIHDEFGPLDVLRGLPVVHIVHAGTDPDDVPFIGGQARRAKRLGAGHATYVAMTSRAGVLTSRADQIRAVLTDDWPVIEV
jgi:hypothetical protein